MYFTNIDNKIFEYKNNKFICRTIINIIGHRYDNARIVPKTTSLTCEKIIKVKDR